MSRLESLINSAILAGPTLVPTVELLDLFGRKRRGSVVNKDITRWAAENHVTLTPPIDDADYYGSIKIEKDENVTVITPPKSAFDPKIDNNWVLSSLKSDAEELDCLHYQDRVEDELSIMREKGHTRLPLFFSSDDHSKLLGTVTIESLAHDRISADTRLIECATSGTPVVSTNEKLFEWIPTIIQPDYIFGKDQNNQIV